MLPVTHGGNRAQHTLSRYEVGKYMTGPATFTQEHRSWQWELVLRYEDGSLPASEWTVETLTVVAGWYAKNLPPEQAKARYEQAYRRNHHRLSNRRDGAVVATDAIRAVDAAWEPLLTRALETGA